LTEPKYVISTCLDPSIFSTLGSELGGSYVDTTSNETSAEDALYAAITQKFAPSVNGNPNASVNQAAGLIPVLSLLDIMSGYTGAVTPAAIKGQLALSTQRTVLLSGGITYVCNGKARARSSRSDGYLGGGSSPPPRYAASRAAASRPSSAAGPAVTRSPCTSTAAWSATSRAS
jgi:hypothetical protein